VSLGAVTLSRFIQRLEAINISTILTAVFGQKTQILSGNSGGEAVTLFRFIQCFEATFQRFCQ
jgi:hypothetical protein